MRSRWPSMARAVRNRIASRGLVAAELSLLAYGGCGGLFAADIARDVGCPARRRARARRRCSPRSAPRPPPCTASGCSRVAVRLPGDPRRCGRRSLELRRGGARRPRGRRRRAGRVHVGFEADVRFERQGAELTIPLPPSARDDLDLDALAGAFRDEYVRRFGGRRGRARRRGRGHDAARRRRGGGRARRRVAAGFGIGRRAVRSGGPSPVGPSSGRCSSTVRGRPSRCRSSSRAELAGGRGRQRSRAGRRGRHHGVDRPRRRGSRWTPSAR